MLAWMSTLLNDPEFRDMIRDLLVQGGVTDVGAILDLIGVVFVVL